MICYGSLKKPIQSLISSVMLKKLLKFIYKMGKSNGTHFTELLWGLNMWNLTQCQVPINTAVKVGIKIIIITAIHRQLERINHKGLEWASAPAKVHFQGSWLDLSGLFEHAGDCG